MPTARSDFSTSVVDSKIFAIGGQDTTRTGTNLGIQALSKVEMYDPETDTWEQRANMPTPRSAVSTSVVDGKIFAIGGDQAREN